MTHLVPTSRSPLTTTALQLTLLAAGVASASCATTIPTVETVAEFDQRPGNPSVTPDGRILLSFQPLDDPSVKVVEVMPDGSMQPYPNASFASGEGSTLEAVIGVRTDDEGVAWMLDMGTHSLLGWNTRTEELVRTITVSEDALKPTSFLQDFALDQERGRVIIADMTQGDLTSAPVPAFIVVDLATGRSTRIAESHASMMPESDGGFALNPITIDPTYEYVYFGALNGHSVYRVPAASFDDLSGSTVIDSIERFGPKPFCDGITVDGAENVYITDVEARAIGVTSADGYRILAKLPLGQSWPDGFCFGADGMLYATVNQLDRSAALSGEETGSAPYLLVKVKPLSSSSTGR